MKTIVILLTLLLSPDSIAKNSWIDNVQSPDKAQQLDLRWRASGGEMDIQFAYKKLEIMELNITPFPEFPNKSWESNHLVFPINQDQTLELFVPYGSIKKATAGSLQSNTDISLQHHGNIIHISQLNFIPQEKDDGDYDIVVFNITDQKGQHLFTTNNVHIKYSTDRKLLKLENMDLFATSELANILNMPELSQQGIGTVSTYSILDIPDEALFNLAGGSCLTNPNFNNGVGVDVRLVTIADIDWKGLVSGTDNVIISPSAELENVGQADVPWYVKYTADSPPYNNDQHPFLTWSVYREIDNRFEQIGISGVKHAFFSTNINCSCPGGNILGVGCGDVYSSFNNDSDSALGPRDEIEADTGVWENCGTFFDPIPCAGSQQNFSSGSGQHRLSLSPAEIVPNLYMQAWYLIRDDIDIFNSMGYRKFSPTLINTTWIMNPESVNNFQNGAAIFGYVDPDNIGPNEYIQTVETGEGQFTVAVKVIDLGGGLYRYNYAIENFEFDPRFIQYQIPFSSIDLFTNTHFSDPDQDDGNNWVFSVDSSNVSVTGNAQNEQDWGMMFSFSFTTDLPPTPGNITINAAHANELVLPENATLQALTLVPSQDLIFESGFE